MVAGVFVFADHMSPRPARFNSRFNLLGQSSFLSWPIWSVNAIPESLFWCSGSQNFSQYLMALHFVFVRIGKRPTSDLHAFELQNLLTPKSHLMNFVCTNSIGSFSSFPSWSTPQTGWRWRSGCATEILKRYHQTRIDLFKLQSSLIRTVGCSVAIWFE